MKSRRGDDNVISSPYSVLMKGEPMSKKRGFTLVEVLVVLAVATLVFILVGGFLVYLTESSGMLIQESEELMTAQSIEDYIRGYISLELKKDGAVKNDIFNKLLAQFDVQNHENTSGVIRLDENGDLHFVEDPAKYTPIFKNTGLNFFYIYKSPDGFLKCEMHFESGTEFTFILGVYSYNGG